MLIPRGYAAVIEKRIDLIDTAGEESGYRQPEFLVVSGDQTSPKAGRPLAYDIEPAAVVLPEYETVPVAFIHVQSFPDRELVPQSRFCHRGTNPAAAAVITLPSGRPFWRRR